MLTPWIVSALALTAFVVLTRMAVLTPTNRFINVTSMSFTPTGGTLTLIKGVQSANLDYNPEDVSDGGDGDLYNTVGALVKMDPTVTVEFLNALALAALTPGVYGTLTFTMADSKNQSTTAGGAQIFTVTNCYYMPRGINNQFRQLSKTTAMFKTASVDGQTSPIANAAA